LPASPRNQAATAILDVTGVPEADAGVATVLIRAARAGRLLGTEVLLSGVRPAMARALVELGIELTGLVTRGSLASAIEATLRR
jgi:rsbT co-antagonist protein RsbR